MSAEEIGREDVTAAMLPPFGFAFSCRGCSREITLHYNGGELDQVDCCGYRYALETPRIDFVTYYVDSTPASPCR